MEKKGDVLQDSFSSSLQLNSSSLNQIRNFHIAICVVLELKCPFECTHFIHAETELVWEKSEGESKREREWKKRKNEWTTNLTLNF